jgi:hypothetical protein
MGSQATLLGSALVELAGAVSKAFARRSAKSAQPSHASANPIGIMMILG